MLVPLLAALAIGLIALLGMFLEPGRRRLARRARRLSGETAAKRAAAGVPTLRLKQSGGLDNFAHRFIPQPQALRDRLEATGTEITIGQYALACAGLALVVPVPLLIKGLSLPLALLAGLFVGLALPHMVVGSLVKRRRKKFLKAFPEAIGLMVRGLKAGLPVSETIGVVGREVVDPVGEEFRRVSDQVRLGQPLEKCLWQTAKRLDMPEFNFLVITLSVQRETGGNLAETLENLDDILRKREQMHLKVRAMSSEAVASAGIIGSLPFVIGLLMFIVSREYVMTLFRNDLGLMMLAAGGVSMSIGVFIMARMVAFDI